MSSRERLARIIYDSMPDGSKRLVAYDSFEAPEPITWDEAKRENSAIVREVYKTVDKIQGVNSGN